MAWLVFTLEGGSKYTVKPDALVRIAERSGPIPALEADVNQHIILLPGRRDHAPKITNIQPVN